jgi:hypothetical protein
MISISEIFWYNQSVFILQNKIYSFLRQSICIYINWINSFNLFFSFKWGIVL